MRATARPRCIAKHRRYSTPRAHARRGSQVGLTRAGADAASGAYAIVQALAARGVIGDFRAGDGDRHADILRFGLTPLTLGFADIWNAVEQLRQVLNNGEWRRPEFGQKSPVT